MYAELLRNPNPRAIPYDAARQSVPTGTAMGMGKRATFRERIDCWLHTLRLVAEMKPPPPPSTVCRFDAARWPPPPSSVSASSTEIRVEDADTIDCALALCAAGYNPAALNLADDRMPGGCVDIGSGAQEESLFRRTALCATLRRDLYPIADDAGIYSPDVPVLKASEAEAWALDSQRRSLCFLTVPGVNCPRCDYGPRGRDVPRMVEADARRFLVKARTMLQMAADRGHDSVVLGASGCGAWKCPPAQVAELFAEALGECRGVFRLVVFAVLKAADLGGRDEDNHAVFARQFVDDSFSFATRAEDPEHSPEASVFLQKIGADASDDDDVSCSYNLDDS